MSHTPGPWAIERNHNGRIFGISALSAKHDLDMVCDLPFQSSNVENDANAKLIAAAPELLKALQRARADLIAEHGMFGFRTNFAYIDEAIDQAAAQKAETSPE
jgi:hypothetical protein